MRTVSQFLQQKEHPVWSVNPETPLPEALDLMAEKNIGAVIVLEGKRLVGILSERDYARHVIRTTEPLTEILVKEIMPHNVIHIGMDTLFEECMALMNNQHTRHLPVLEKDQVVGMISIGDVVKEIIEEQDFHIQNLQKYITGAR